MVDEIDKVRGHHGYDPSSGLLMLLEPRTAARFTDLSVPQVQLDARHVLWIAVSNDASQINAPMLSRFERFDIPAPDQTQTANIARSIYRRTAQSCPWGQEFEPELDPKVAALMSAMPPRQIRLTLESAFGRAALAGRNHLAPQDLAYPKGQSPKSQRPIGFVRFAH